MSIRILMENFEQPICTCKVKFTKCKFSPDHTFYLSSITIRCFPLIEIVFLQKATTIPFTLAFPEKLSLRTCSFCLNISHAGKNNCWSERSRGNRPKNNLLRKKIYTIQISKRHRNKADGKLAYANEVYKYGECKSSLREPQYNIEAYGTFLR